jgi:hypothetical protein
MTPAPCSSAARVIHGYVEKASFLISMHEFGGRHFECRGYTKQRREPQILSAALYLTEVFPVDPSV